MYQGVLKGVCGKSWSVIKYYLLSARRCRTQIVIARSFATKAPSETTPFRSLECNFSGQHGACRVSHLHLCLHFDCALKAHRKTVPTKPSSSVRLRSCSSLALSASVRVLHRSWEVALFRDSVLERGLRRVHFPEEPYMLKFRDTLWELSGPLNRLNLYYLCFSPLPAIVRALGRPYLALSRIHTQVGVLNRLALNNLGSSTARLWSYSVWGGH